MDFAVISAQVRPINQGAQDDGGDRNQRQDEEDQDDRGRHLTPP